MRNVSNPITTRRAPRLADDQDRFAALTPRSRKLWTSASDVFPLGVSGAAKYYKPYPIFLAEASGSTVVDVDSNRYVDVLMGAGPLLLGHNHPRVVDVVREQAARMTQPMSPTEASMVYAERIRSHMPYLERIRFTNTGSEATRTALRIARSATGRIRFAKFEGGFHGSDDAFLVSTHAPESAGPDARPEPVLDYAGLPPRLLDEVVVLPYNDAEAAAGLIDEHGHELAAVIMEPVAFSSGGGVLATREFSQAVREATRRHGVVLIFDEVVCAYRLGLGGAPAYLGVAPDLSTIGKAIGGGLPLAAVGGRADLLDSTLAGSVDRRVFQSGTFTENPLSIAAGMAALEVLETEPAALEQADAAGDRLRTGLNGLFEEYSIAAITTGVASIFQVHVGVESVENRRDVLRSDLESTRRFLVSMITEGVLWPPIHPGVTSAAHTPDDVDAVIAAARRILDRADSRRS